MRIAMTDLGLERLTVVYPGDRSYRLLEGIEVTPLVSLLEQEPRASVRGSKTDTQNETC